MRRLASFSLAVSVSMFVTVAGCKRDSAPPAEQPAADEVAPAVDEEPAPEPLVLATGDTVEITKVIKGDELVGTKGDKEVTLRLLGVHTLSPTAEEGAGKRLGEAAKEWVSAQVLGKKLGITLGKTPRDAFDRYLVYASLDGKDFNRTVLEAGQGVVYTEYAFEKEADYLAAEKAVREAKTGLWGDAKATELITSLRGLWAETRADDGNPVPVDELAASE